MAKDNLQRQVDTLPVSAQKAIAARVAIRAVPLLVHFKGNRPSALHVLSALRGAFMTVLAAQYPNDVVIQNRARDAKDFQAYKDEMQMASSSMSYAGYLSYQTIEATTGFASSPTVDPAIISHSDVNLADGLSQDVTGAVVLNLSKKDHEAKPAQVLENSIWHGREEPDWLASRLRGMENLLMSEPAWLFWKDWYEDLAHRQVADWELWRRVGTEIPNAVWQEGPSSVAEAIRRIEVGHTDRPQERGPIMAVTQEEIKNIANRLVLNRDALVVSTESLIVQLEEFGESVRCSNSMPQDIREEMLQFVVDMCAKLSELKAYLSESNSTEHDVRAERVALWLRGYQQAIRSKLKFYSSSENVADATVPTAFILGATGIGAMLGQPLAGAVVGGLIANQVKPSQAARDLLRSSKQEGE